MEVFRTRSVEPGILLGRSKFLGLVLCTIFPSTISHHDQSQQCNIVPRSLSLPVLEKEGDIVLGGLFSLHDMVLESTVSFTSTPPPKQCTRQAVGKKAVICRRCTVCVVVSKSFPLRFIAGLTSARSAGCRP